MSYDLGRSAVISPGGASSGTADGLVAEPPGRERLVSAAIRVAGSALDALIVLYAVGLMLIAVRGGVDLGFVRFHRAAKPVLMLIGLVPVRLALGGPSWLGYLCRQSAARLKVEWAQMCGRVPAAVADSAFAIATVSAASLSATFFANLVLAPASARAFSLPFANEKFVEIFAAWDSGWYWDIATHGYYFRPDAQSSIAYFPLYPMLMRAAAAPFGGGDAATWIAGIVVSFAAFAAALVAVHRLTERIFEDREIARRAVLYIAVFPWSLFMTRVYTESVFLLTTVLAVSHAWESRWSRAGLWGALATLTRPNGILIGVPLLLLAARGRPGLRTLATRLLVLAPIPAALVGYSAYVYWLTGDPLGWMSAQAQWGYSLGHPPWQQLLRVVTSLMDAGIYRYFFPSDIAPAELLHAVTALIFVALTPAVFRQLGAAMGTYTLVNLLVPLSSNTLEGLGRYTSVLFPAFMLAATWKSVRAHEAILIFALIFQTLVAWLFITWQPIY